MYLLYIYVVNSDRPQQRENGRYDWVNSRVLDKTIENLK